MNDLLFFKLRLIDEYAKLEFMIQNGFTPIDYQIQVVDNLLQKLVECFNYHSDLAHKFERLIESEAIRNPKNLVDFSRYEFSKN